VTAYWQERSTALEAVGLDPDGDDWALPDNDYVEEQENERAKMFAIMEDPWGDGEEDA
jgi:hypothetical protein